MQDEYRYHWKAQSTLFRYENLFALFSRRAERYTELGKSTRFTFCVPVPKVIEVMS